MIDIVDLYIGLRFYMVPLCIIFLIFGVSDMLIERNEKAKNFVDSIIYRLIREKY